ncbi:MAG: hypothetical protein ACD_16C00043G0005 [uncultured bacterium]|nr:MAG: hypothetical protein ACD_16C00043G0005 [uncultured bacterium]OFW68406.1 MAG: hypothetical protein A2X70_06875 [Alphaproteobacteria bacterium GWC2_42_16]OFW73040.1 MAG: hypothetical protein A2Z80_07370 [Alphaproteobacteria bacterium GWA2_41_27]OFW81498.1 MAG: hypothetical protein A3E50_05845 [Alphaproteobacteria bacterium RIFCSPHIGHO2_12_FULL_42_100]OFW85243.1 MAG: hypothetical protein A2W06_07500 [Alphaproteobacteria bacterium RBG_16_42_14]OFW91078.1 MAG: hypothetical protein A2W46_056
MKEITTRDLKESLVLLLLKKKDDGEGGWQEDWCEGPRLWAALWPFVDNQKGTPLYRIILRAPLILPHTIKFLWRLQHTTKRLVVIKDPILVQYNRFYAMIAEEEKNA